MCRRLQPYVSQAIHQLLDGGAHVNAADTSGVLPIGFAAHKAPPCMHAPVAWMHACACSLDACLRL